MTDIAVVQSAVRLPTPPPGEPEITYRVGDKRKIQAISRSPSPGKRRPSPLRDEVDSVRRIPAPENGDSNLHRDPLRVLGKEEKEAAAKAEYEKLLSMRSGGTYIPPARLRALQSQITDKTSKEYQRMAWEALKKSINGLINKVNISNIKHIVPELFGENLIRGRGLFCRSIMKAQAASLPFTPIYAAMAAIVNTKLPQVGELLIGRLITQFKKAFRRNDKAVCLSSTTFLAHLVNQQVVHEMLVAQILLLLLHKPTDDGVEIAVGLTREVGQHLTEMNAAIAMAVFDQFRNILHEHDLDKRVQYMIEVLFQVRKDKFKDNPSIKEELDLVEEDDQITHKIELDDDVTVQDSLNIFKFDAEWEEHEGLYKRLKAEILGEASGDEDDSESDGSDLSDDDAAIEEREMEIKDQSNTDLVNLRKTIYLTLQSSVDFEEACHKLMKVNIPQGKEEELPSMIVEYCAQEKTYSKFIGLVGERFAKLNRLWTQLFEESFVKYYDTIHRFETNRLRNIARFFGHMFSSDAVGWHCLSAVHLNEEETTSSSRIFIKIFFQDMAEALGLPNLANRFKDTTLKPSLNGIFPKDNPRDVRFAINYFTSIGMGAITEDMREYLKSMPNPALPALAGPNHAPSRSGSVSSYSSFSSRSLSRSRSPNRNRRRPIRNPSKTPSRPRDSKGRGREIARHSSSDRSYSSYLSGSRTPPRQRGNVTRPAHGQDGVRGRSPEAKRRSRIQDYRSRSRTSSSPSYQSRDRLRRSRKEGSFSRSPSPRRQRTYNRSALRTSPTSHRHEHAEGTMRRSNRSHETGRAGSSATDSRSPPRRRK